jgi:hypothetical protein
MEENRGDPERKKAVKLIRTAKIFIEDACTRHDSSQIG